MEIKTCEEYVLNKLFEAENTIEELNDKIRLLEKKISDNDEMENSEETIVRDKTAGVYYWYSVIGSYEIEGVCDKNGWSVDDLRECLADFEKLQEFGNIKQTDSWRGTVAYVSDSTHCGLIKFNGVTAVLTYSSSYRDMPELNLYTIGNRFFLDKDECETAMYDALRSEISKYLERYGKDE